MAQILNNPKGRRSIKLSIDDVLSIVREYQNLTKNQKTYNEIRNQLLKTEFYLPEE